MTVKARRTGKQRINLVISSKWIAEQGLGKLRIQS